MAATPEDEYEGIEGRPPERWGTLIRLFRKFEEHNPFCVIGVVETIRTKLRYQYSTELIFNDVKPFANHALPHSCADPKVLPKGTTLRDLDKGQFLNHPFFENMGKDPLFDAPLDTFSTVVVFLVPFHSDSLDYMFIKTDDVVIDTSILPYFTKAIRMKWYKHGNLHSMRKPSIVEAEWYNPKIYVRRDFMVRRRIRGQVKRPSFLEDSDEDTFIRY